jgi:hypothetical protein
MIFVITFFWWLWGVPVVYLSLVVQHVLRLAGWLEVYRTEVIEWGQEVDTYFAAGWLAKHWPIQLGGCAWLPACVILSPRYDRKVNGLRPKDLNQTLIHELEHANQWRQWSLLFPLAYGVAALFALPRPYRNNYFERRARRVAGQGE